jgi:ribosomal protein L5
MQVPGPGQDRGEHGRRRRRPGQQADRGRVRDLATITGQKPEDPPGRKSIAQFKLREGSRSVLA